MGASRLGVTVVRKPITFAGGKRDVINCLTHLSIKAKYMLPLVFGFTPAAAPAPGRFPSVTLLSANYKKKASNSKPLLSMNTNLISGNTFVNIIILWVYTGTV